jgi:hypothetical protein
LPLSYFHLHLGLGQDSILVSVFSQCVLLPLVLQGSSGSGALLTYSHESLTFATTTTTYSNLKLSQPRFLYVTESLLLGRRGFCLNKSSQISAFGNVSPSLLYSSYSLNCFPFTNSSLHMSILTILHIFPLNSSFLIRCGLPSFRRLIYSVAVTFVF